jgi:hypothetical protein
MIVATMVVASVYGISAVRDMGYASANETLKRLCETGEKNLDNYFSSVEQSVEMVEAYIESDLDGADDARLQAHLDRVSEICKRIMSKTDGVMTYYYRIDPAVSTNVGGFWYVRGEDGEFYPHEVTDITQYDTSDTSKLVWFTVPKENGKPVWLPPYITDNLGARVLSFNIPIYHEGTFVGVFGIEIDYSTMAEQVDNISLYDSGYAFINDTEGGIIYHPRMDVTTMEEQPKVPDGLLGEDNLVRYTYDGAEKLGGKLGGQIDGRGAVRAADDADGSGLGAGEAQEVRAEEGEEHTELGSCAEDQGGGTGDQGTEVGHGADAHEDQRGVETQLDADVEDVEEAALLEDGFIAVVGSVVRIEESIPEIRMIEGVRLGQAHEVAHVDQQAAKGDAHQQQGLKLLDDAEIEQDARDQDHDRVLPSAVVEQSGKAGALEQIA